MSSPILNLEQMKQQYHDEWLLIAYTDIDEKARFRLVLHSCYETLFCSKSQQSIHWQSVEI